MVFFYLFIFFFCGSVSGCPATSFCKLSDFSEPIEPCWESNRTCQPDPGQRWGTDQIFLIRSDPRIRGSWTAPNRGFSLPAPLWSADRQGLIRPDQLLNPLRKITYYWGSDSTLTHLIYTWKVYLNEYVCPQWVKLELLFNFVEDKFKLKQKANWKLHFVDLSRSRFDF
jgi:hypothetical protein